MMPLGLLADGEHAMVVSIKEREGHGHAGGAGGCHACGGGLPGKHCETGSLPLAHAAHPETCHHEGRMEDMGIRAGKEVQMLRNPGRGPLLLKVDEARIAIGRAMAMRIFVTKASK